MGQIAKPHATLSLVRPLTGDGGAGGSKKVGIPFVLIRCDHPAF
jgi:hypothetical protein